MWSDYYDKKCYKQTDTYGSWRDMHDLNTKKEIVASWESDIHWATSLGAPGTKFGLFTFRSY